jgi:hypothetical protein
MSDGEGVPDESGKDLTKAARGASFEPLVAWVRARIPPAWRRPRRLVLVGALLLAVVALIFTTRSSVPRHPAPGTTIFPVGQQVALRFVHSTGSVRVKAGPGGQVSITEHRSGFTDAIHTRYRQQGDVITVTVSVQNGLPVATWVDFVVALPQDETAKVAVSAGTLTAAGLTGNFALKDTGGSIWAAKVGGAIALQTASGSITTSKVSAQVSAITDNGTITSISTRLRGRSLIEAQDGTINFHGSLEPGCHALFQNTTGAIGVTLPNGSPVLVDARTLSGSINSQFSTVHVVTDSGGRAANGRLGRDPSAHLRIRTKGGSIDLNHRT